MLWRLRERRQRNKAPFVKLRSGSAIHRFEGLPPYYFIRYMAEPEFAPAVQITLVNAKENAVRIIFDVEGKVHYQDSPMVRKAIKEMEEFCAACEAAQLFKIIKD